MQTWAKRGFQAALVTGGVLAAGTGVASATQNGPQPHADQDGTPEPRGLFTEAASPVTALSGHLDLVRDVLPAVQDAQTREMPALGADGQPRSTARRAARPATGQHAAPDPDARTVRFPIDGGRGTKTVPLRSGQHAQPRTAARGRHAAPAGSSPSDGFHRSVTWKGPLGEVLSTADAELPPAARTDERAAEQTSPVLPVIDPQPLAALGGLVAPESVDLTSGRLAPTTTTRTVPHPVLASAAANSRPRPVPRSETVPLQVPGEHQEKATDVPSIAAALLADGKSASGAAAPTPASDAPLNRITGALAGEPAPAPAPESAPSPGPVVAETVQFQRIPAFTDDPHALPASARQLDPLAAVKAERDHIADNPFRSEIGTRRAAAAGLERGMALPLLDGVTHRVLPELGGDGETTDVLPVLAGA